jgi:hypothetical protein
MKKISTHLFFVILLFLLIAQSGFSQDLPGGDIFLPTPEPSAPPQPSITQYCGYTRLTRATPPTGVTYFWQTSASGTNTSNSSTTYTATSAGTYYLRAREGVTWSLATATSVSIKAIPSNPVSNDVTRCGTGVVTFNASCATFGATIKWYNSDVLMGEGTSFSDLASGTTTYTVKSYLSGCYSSGITVSSSTKPIPNPAIVVTESSGLAHNDGTTCSGANVTLTASGGITYIWNDNSTTASKSYSPTATTTYTVTVTGSNGCSSATSKTITVNSLPSASIAIAEHSELTNNDGVICSGASVTLTASGGGSYLWNDGSTTVSKAINPTSNATYVVTVTNSNKCVASASKSISVRSLPTAQISVSESSGLHNNDGTICSGESVALTASGGATYLWNDFSDGTTQTYSPTSSKTYSVTVTDSKRCSSAASKVITVNSLPSASIVVTESSGTTNNDGTTCSGASVTLTASGGTSYEWNDGSATASKSYSPTATTTYIVTVTNSNNCSSSKSRSISVNTLPTASIAVSEISGLASNDGIVCSGESLSLTASGGTSYLWNDGSTTASKSYSPTVRTTYTVTVTNSNNCSSNKSKAITVNALPTAQISVVDSSGTANNDGTTCSGANVMLTASGGSSYQWLDGSTTTTKSYSPTATTTYTVTVTNSNGCSSPKDRVITVNSLPTALISVTESSGATNNDGITCSGASVTLTASGGSSYLWNDGSATASKSYSPTATTTYTVTVTNSNNCRSTKSKAITVNALPIPTFTQQATDVCPSTSGNVYTTQAGKSNYNWLLPADATINSGGGASNNSVDITWGNSGAHTVVVNYTDANSCVSASGAVSLVNVKEIPTPTFVQEATDVCLNSSGNVYTTQAGKSNYNWLIPGDAIVTSGGQDTDNSITITWEGAGSREVYVRYTDINSCSAVSDATSNVLVRALPITPTINTIEKEFPSTVTLEIDTEMEVTWYEQGQTSPIGTGVSFNQDVYNTKQYEFAVTDNYCVSERGDVSILINNPNPSVLYAINNGNWTTKGIWSGAEGGQPTILLPSQQTAVVIKGNTINVSENLESGSIILETAEIPTILNITEGVLNVYGQVEIKRNEQNSEVKLDVSSNANLIVNE